MTGPEEHASDCQSLAPQQRRHLVALYLSARNHAARLEALVAFGRSPSGYGAPLAPLTPEHADAIMAPVRELLAQLQGFVRVHAPEELDELEREQHPHNTLVWASQIMSNLRDVAEELTPRRLARWGSPAPDDTSVDALRETLMATIAQARSALGEAGGEDPQQQ